MADLVPGQYVQLSDGRNGTIRFVGTTLFAAGEWVGVELEDESGKNDGSVQGERYFDVEPRRGMFVRPGTVTVLAQPQTDRQTGRRDGHEKAAGNGGVGGRRVSGRPSSLLGAGGAARGAAADPGLGKRMSLNAPSPTPTRTSRPSSIARSPTKSPTKLHPPTANSSASTSRTNTPSNARASSVGIKSRPSAVGTTRTSMGPPPAPGRATSGTTKQVSTSSTGTARSGALASRPAPGRLSLAGPRAVPGAAARLDGGRKMSADSQSGAESGPASARLRDRGAISSPDKSNGDILSPQPKSPVQAKTAALEKLIGEPPATAALSPKPPPSATASTSSAVTHRPAANSAAATRRIEDLEAKMRVLERKRLEDRDKIKQLDKIQGERDKFEAIIQKLQTKYQPQQQENNDLRKQLKEAEARLESVESMQAEYESTLELATLDREMAEETAEVLKSELEALKLKTEEMELEVEVLKEENEQFAKGMTPEERASQGWLQMEKNNERLREALLRLRDITQQQEEELRDQIKGLEEDLEEFGRTKEQFESTKEKLGQSEAAVEDLRQQLDNALGAEDMIEDLTERNMSQAEQIEELKAVVEDLESLKEINDELEVNHVQNEREMQEDLDFKDSVIAEQARRSAQQDEALEDMEYTLTKFRDLVTSLQSDLEDMRASHAVTEVESEQLNSRSRAMMDLNVKLQLSAAKAQVKTIDLELRRLEAQEAEQHLEIVKLFLPESYQTDRDSVLALLRFRRLAFKATLIQGFLRDRTSAPAHAGHEDDLLAATDAIDKLTWVSAMCERFVSAISHCSPDRFARFEGALYELEPVERALNAWIDGLRRDELKEKQVADELSRSIALMAHLAEVHLSGVELEGVADDLHMRALCVQSHLDSAATVFGVVKEMVARTVPAGEDDELAQYFSRKSETVVAQTRSAKVVAGKMVRALEDLRSRSLALAPSSLQAFEQSEAAAKTLADFARKIGLDLHHLLHEEGRAEPYTYSEVQSTAQRTALSVAGAEDSDLFSTFLAQLRSLSSQITDLSNLSSDLSQTTEFERAEAPWLIRARDLKAAKQIAPDIDEELRRLKEESAESRRQLAQREESLSTAQLKIDTLEARMRDAKSKSERITQLENEVAAEQKVVRSLKEDVDKQDRELKVLEAERDKWKGVAEQGGLRVNGAVGGRAGSEGGERAVATAREMDALKSEVEALQAAVRYLRGEIRRARLDGTEQQDWLSEPLVKPVSAAERRKKLLVAEGKDVLGELLRLATSDKETKVFDLSTLPEDRLAWRPAKSTPQYRAARQEEQFAAWRSWRDELVGKTKAIVSREAALQELHKNGKQSRNALSGKSGSAINRSAGRMAAKLQIRLPGQEGKAVPGSGNGSVRIVEPEEWEGLLGRVVV